MVVRSKGSSSQEDILEPTEIVRHDVSQMFENLLKRNATSKALSLEAQKVLVF